MTDQNTFMETVRSVAEIIRTSGEPLSEEEILAYFEDMELDDNQKSLVLEYLKNPQSEEVETDHSPDETEPDVEMEEADAQEGEAAGKSQESESEESRMSPVFKMYLEELSYLPSYSKTEEEQMYRELLQGEESVIKKLSDCWLKRVLTIAEKYIEPKLNVEDLIQEGNMALFLTLQGLCGSKEKTDVESVLEGAIEEGIMSYASEMNSERELENTILGKVSLIHEAKKLLTEENGQEPSLIELSDYTKMSVEELEEILEMIKTTGDKA